VLPPFNSRNAIFFERVEKFFINRTHKLLEAPVSGYDDNRSHLLWREPRIDRRILLLSHHVEYDRHKTLSIQQRQGLKNEGGEREERGRREGGEREERGRREGGEREERGRREGESASARLRAQARTLTSDRGTREKIKKKGEMARACAP
jgi:hypothetical protein